MRENATSQILLWTTQNPSRSYILTKTWKQFDKKVLYLQNFKTLQGLSTNSLSQIQPPRKLSTDVCWVPTQRLPSYTTQQSWQKVRRWLNIDIKKGTLTVKFWKMMSMDQGACWHTADIRANFLSAVSMQSKLREVEFHEARKLRLKHIKKTSLNYYIWETFFPDTNPSSNLPPLHWPTDHPQGFPDAHRLSEGGWNTVSGSQTLGPLQQCWESLKSPGVAKMGGQEGETTLTVVYYAVWWKRDTRKQQQTKIHIINLLLFKNPSSFYINPSRFNMNTLFNTLLHVQSLVITISTFQSFFQNFFP